MDIAAFSLQLHPIIPHTAMVLWQPQMGKVKWGKCKHKLDNIYFYHSPQTEVTILVIESWGWMLGLGKTSHITFGSHNSGYEFVLAN